MYLKPVQWGALKVYSNPPPSQACENIFLAFQREARAVVNGTSEMNIDRLAGHTKMFENFLRHMALWPK